MQPTTLSKAQPQPDRHITGISQRSVLLHPATGGMEYYAVKDGMAYYVTISHEACMSSKLNRLARLLSDVEAPEICISAEQYTALLDQHVMVLEGLEISASEVSQYISGSGTDNETVLSEELQKKALKWLKAADDLSEGEIDIARTTTNNAYSWGTLGLEAIDTRGIFKRILNTIGAFFKYIWDMFLKMKAKFDLGAARKRNTDLRNKAQDRTHRVVESIKLGPRIINTFSLKNANKSDAVGHVQARCVDVLHLAGTFINEFGKMAQARNAGLLKNTAPAVEAIFSDVQLNASLCVSLAALDINQLATLIDAKRYTPEYGEHHHYYRSEKLFGGRFIELSAPKNEWSGDPSDLDTMGKMESSVGLYVLRHVTFHIDVEYDENEPLIMDIPALTAHENDQLLSTADKLIASITSVDKHLDALEQSQKRMEQIVKSLEKDLDVKIHRHGSMSPAFTIISKLATAAGAPSLTLMKLRSNLQLGLIELQEIVERS